MKFPGSITTLKTTNNILFGLSLFSFFIISFRDLPPKSAAEEFGRNAAGYTLLGFLTVWVISMLAAFTCEILKKEGLILTYILRASCVLGILHFCCLPLMFVL